MKTSAGRAFFYGMLGVFSLLLSGIAYAAGHKPFSAENLIGVFTGLWQLLIAILIVALAGGLGERLLGSLPVTGMVRFGFATALGIVLLSTGFLLLGSLVGTGLAALALPALILLLVLRGDIRAWLNTLDEARKLPGGIYEQVIALGAFAILIASLGIALAPPTEFDSLVYHYALPRAYLEQGRIGYLPDTIFWGMPQITELLFLPAMRFAGVGAAALTGVLIGIVALIAIYGYVRSQFGGVAAWTTLAALLAGETLSRALSSGYVEWTAVLFGWAALAALTVWLQIRDRRLLALSGIFCGGALGTKYTAGILLLGCIFVLATTMGQISWRQKLAAVLLVGAGALIASLPWWIKNFLGTGNPFYPFFLSSGEMDALRLQFIQQVAIWRDWRAVILIPWQATILGAEGKEGFAASIGPLLVGLSPLAGINWRLRSEAQRQVLLAAAGIIGVGFVAWAVGSRVSGLLIQSRLYFAIFPAWAALAGAGLDGIWALRAGGVRFGRLAGALAALMLAMNVFSTGADFIHRNPLAYVLRQEGEEQYLQRTMGAHAAAMRAIEELPKGSRVLMLWEGRGYYCQPRCDSDEVIDRWYHDSHLYPASQALIQAWVRQGYTHVLIFNLGADYVREQDPAGASMDWALLNTTLAGLTTEKEIGGRAYSLYRLP